MIFALLASSFSHKFKFSNRIDLYTHTCTYTYALFVFHFSVGLFFTFFNNLISGKYVPIIHFATSHRFKNQVFVSNIMKLPH